MQQIGTCEQAVLQMSADTAHNDNQLQVLINRGNADVVSNEGLITHVKSSVWPRKDPL